MKVVTPPSTHTSPDSDASVEPTIDATAVSLWSGLMSHRGHRTVWLADDGTFVHTEPEVELEGEGLAYVATLLRPDLDELNAAMRRAMARMDREASAESAVAALATRGRPSMAVGRCRMPVVGGTPVLVG